MVSGDDPADPTRLVAVLLRATAEGDGDGVFMLLQQLSTVELWLVAARFALLIVQGDGRDPKLIAADLDAMIAQADAAT